MKIDISEDGFSRAIAAIPYDTASLMDYYNILDFYQHFLPVKENIKVWRIQFVSETDAMMFLLRFS